MAKYQNISITIDGEKYPVRFYEERRRSARMSFGKNAIIFRIPSLLLPHKRQEAFEWFEDVVRKRFQQHPELKTQYGTKRFHDGDIIQVGNRSYQLNIKFSDKKTHKARLQNGIISLQLASGDNEFHLQKSIRHLLSRVIAQDFKPHISRRVMELNRLYFNKNIKSVNLKYNQTNWGSCSTKGNVNLSTRLLFAPDEVIDYVIIHELAHLIEMNHSNRFWKLVADAMPDYKQKEKWLKDNRHKCDF